MLELSTAMIALLRSTLGFHPLIVPSSVSKMKAAEPDTPFSETTKPLLPLATTPVGVPGTTPPEADGMVTTSGTALPHGP